MPLRNRDRLYRTRLVMLCYWPEWRTSNHASTLQTTSRNSFIEESTSYIRTQTRGSHSLVHCQSNDVSRRIFGPWRGLWHFPNVLQRRTASQSRFLSLLGWLESPGIRKHDSDDSKPRSCPLIKILPRSILSWTPNGRPRKAAKKFAALVVILFPYNVTKDGNALMYIYIYYIHICPILALSLVWICC